MTDNTKLIAEARANIEHLARGIPGSQADRVRAGESSDPRVSLVVRLTDALEAAEQRITELEADARAEANRVMTTEHTVNVMRADWEALRAERDALAAVIEQADAKLRDTRLQIHTRNDEAATILASADTDAALREVRAKVLDALANALDGPGADVVYQRVIRSRAAAIREGRS